MPSEFDIFNNIAQFNTLLALIALLGSGTSAWWTFEDPLFRHPICRAPIIGGFIGFAFIMHLVSHEALNGIQFIILLASIICMLTCGFNHQRAATKLMMDSKHHLSSAHFLMTEGILVVYAGGMLLLGYKLFVNVF